MLVRVSISIEKTSSYQDLVRPSSYQRILPTFKSGRCSAPRNVFDVQTKATVTWVAIIILELGCTDYNITTQFFYMNILRQLMTGSCSQVPEPAGAI